MPDEPLDGLLIGELYQTIGQQAQEIRSLTKLVGLLRKDLALSQESMEAVKHELLSPRARRAT